MKSIISFAVLVATFLVDVDARRNVPRSSGDNAVPGTVFAPTPMPHRNRHDRARVRPSKNVTFHYGSDDAGAEKSVIDVAHIMRYPSVMLEDIDAITNVDCSINSVALTFRDSSTFAYTKQIWTGKFIMVTNHLGDCDVELERGVFLVDSLHFDDTALVVTAQSQMTDVSSVAASTAIKFGNLPGTALVERDLISNSSYTLNSGFSLPPDTTLFSQAPYLKVTANSGSYTSNVTFSGYLRYNWLLVKLEALYFDIDTAFTSSLTLSAVVTSAYSNTFTYAPATLGYSFISVPGIIELGPALKFQVGAFVSASEAVDLTTTFGVALRDGNIHLDALDSKKTGSSGWTPSYSASANISGVAVAQINPFAALTVELAIDFFGGLIDLSTGVTAKPGLNNTFTLSATEGGGVSGLTKAAASRTCKNGLAIESIFTFSIDAFATQWWKQELYSVKVPVADECYTWRE